MFQHDRRCANMNEVNVDGEKSFQWDAANGEITFGTFSGCSHQLGAAAGTA